MKKRLCILLLVIAFTLPLCAGCTEDTMSTFSSEIPGRTSAPPEEDVYKDLWAKIDGSTATIPLSEGIAKHFLGLDDDQAAEKIRHNRTDAAYRNLVDGAADLIFVTYPSEDESQYATDSGVTLEVIPVVKDALIFLVNKKNPVNSLTQQQLIDIYTDKITNWKDLGGSDAEIKAFQRQGNSGSQTLFLKLLMKNIVPTNPPVELKPADMGGLVEAIADYDNAESALGFSVFYYATDMYNLPGVKLLWVDGVAPNKETIQDGSYPLPTYYYAVLRQDTPAD
ncbi:MAG: substrate-binding domain-containing protein, partial [Oscillospiraceae bacterium]|nr:substrate-binding domain-containing protein [Oscillospiraceae bacterium]